MRKDLIIDGFAWGEVTVGGLDSTDTVLAMFRSLGRQDINCILLSGCVIAWFNVIDIDRLHAATGLPVICVTYEDSEGLERDIESHFPGDPWRLASYRRLGERKAVSLNTGYTAYLRSCGIGYPDAARLCNAFTYGGKIPEPLRVARLCARSVGTVAGKT